MYKRVIVTTLIAMSCSFVNAAEWNIPESKIITSNNSESIRAAAEELSMHLKLVSGADIPVGGPDIAAAAGKTGSNFQFILGQAAPDSTEQAKTAEVSYAIRGNRVYLWGSNMPKFNGIFNAVDFFLERHLNIKWVRPGVSGVVWKEQKQVTLPEREDFSWRKPYDLIQLRSNGIWTYNQAATFMIPEALRYSEDECRAKQREEGVWRARMHHGTRNYIRYGHAFTDWWARYGKTHPEYFGQNEDGTRGPRLDRKENGTFSHLCVSNPAVADQVVANWVAAGKPKYLNVCPNDGPYSWCRCPKCMALDTRPKGEDFFASLSDREIYFWNRITERAIKHRKDVVLISYIYSLYRQPPRRERVEYPDNIIFGVVPVMADNNAELFGAWSKLGAKRFFLRPNDLVDYVEYYRGLDERIFRKYQDACKYGLLFVDYDGLSGKRDADFEFFMTARMMAFPERSFEDIENEYCSAFGPAAAQVKEFFRFQRQCEERRRRNAAAELEKNPQAKQQLVRDFGYDSRVSHNANNLSRFYTDEDMLKGEQILSAGLKQKLTPAERTRLEQMLISQQHSRLVLAAIQAREFKLGRERFKAAARKLLDFRIAHREELNMYWAYFFGKERAIWADTKLFEPGNPENSAYRRSFLQGDKSVEILKDGTAAFCFEVAPNAKNPEWQITAFPVLFKNVAGRNFMFAGEFKLTGRSNGSFRAGIRQVDASGKTISYNWSQPLAADCDWVKFAKTLTASSKAARLEFYLQGDRLNAGARGYLKNFSVTPVAAGSVKPAAEAPDAAEQAESALTGWR